MKVGVLRFRVRVFRVQGSGFRVGVRSRASGFGRMSQLS